MIGVVVVEVDSAPPTYLSGSVIRHTCLMWRLVDSVVGTQTDMETATLSLI